MRWPWRRREPPTNGHLAEEEKQRAESRLAEQRDRWPEVLKASDQFAAIVERAMRGTR